MCCGFLSNFCSKNSIKLVCNFLTTENPKNMDDMESYRSFFFQKFIEKVYVSLLDLHGKVFMLLFFMNSSKYCNIEQRIIKLMHHSTNNKDCQVYLIEDYSAHDFICTAYE